MRGLVLTSLDGGVLVPSIDSLYFPCNDREHMPVFGTAGCLAIFIHFMKGFDLKARESRVDLVCGMKGHSFVNYPRITDAEELTGKASVGFDGRDDLMPQPIKVFRFTKWNT